MNMPGYVYIIQSTKSKIYYIGSSSDPTRRLSEHNWGISKATKNRGPWMIKFQQKYSSLKKVRQIEYKLKKLKRKDYILRIIRDGYIKIN